MQMFTKLNLDMFLDIQELWNSAMFGCSWTEVSVLGRQVFGQASMEGSVLLLQAVETMQWCHRT